MCKPEERLRDGYGRAIRYLRVSVTDRCNLRCRYCMPEDGVDWMDHSNLLSYEQIARLVGLFAKLGVEKVRLTGGEPLVRRDLHRLAAAVSGTPGIREVAVTTNGVLLAEQLPGLVAAGLTGVNMSLDTLDREQFAAITRRDQLPAALAGLEAALAVPGLKVKLNCVPMGENDSQLVPLAALARDRELSVRFIELMPIGLGGSPSPPHRGGGAGTAGKGLWTGTALCPGPGGRPRPVCDLLGLPGPGGLHQRHDPPVLRPVQPGAAHLLRVSEDLPPV